MTALMAAADARCDTGLVMAAIPLHPKFPERICWGCDKYCPADDLACGNGTIRTMHPVELFGEDWLEWSTTRESTMPAATPSAAAPAETIAQK